MAEHEKELLERIAEAIPKLSDYEKGYINGVADNAVAQQKANEEKKERKKED